MNSDLKITLLLVEDDPIQASMGSLRLQKRDYHVIVAHSGEDACIKIEEQPEIDLVLMDIDLGLGMDGTQAAQEILKIRNLPIVFLSSHTDSEMVEKVKNITRFGYIVKSTGDFVLFSGIEMALNLYRTEQKLRESLEMFENISRNINEIFWVEDVVNNTIIYITPSYEKVFGHTIDDLYLNSHSFIDAIIPEDREKVLQSYKLFLATKTSNKIEYRIKKEDGSIRWIAVRNYPAEIIDGEIVRAVGFAEDITHFKTQSMILESRDRVLKSIFHNIPLPSLFITTEFSILDWNKEAEETFGFSKEEVLGKNIFEHIIPKEEHGVVANLADELISSNGVIKKVNWNINKLGNKFLCEWLNTPVYDEKGNLLGIVAIAQDITERKKNIDFLSIQLNQKEILLKEIHHRVKNNMATISALLEIQAHSTENDSAKHHLLDAKGRVNGMMVLYDKLFRSSNYKRASFSGYLASLISEMVSLKRSGTILIHTDVEDIEMDTAILFPLGIIVNELVTNSLKYAFVGRKQGQVSIQGTYEEENNQYILLIGDNGIGWDSKQKKPKGFGLELVGLLVNQIQGTYINSSKTNQGALHEISFPLPPNKRNSPIGQQ
ncbi:MAG: PAS domain S-box protein [Leptospira sp.]|nr:PAS domain S-box protein [Leptospira sp.]